MGRTIHPSRYLINSDWNAITGGGHAHAQPKQPTPQEKMAAMDEYKRQKKQADLELVQKLRYQLATAEAVLAANNEEEVSKPSTGLGRERR